MALHKSNVAFSLQLDESRHVSGLAVVPIVRYLSKNETEKEDLVQCSHFSRFPQFIYAMLDFRGTL